MLQKERGGQRKKISMKAGAILAIMEGIIDGSFGIGTTDYVMEATLEGKSLDEIMFDVVKKKRMKENKESGQGEQERGKMKDKICPKCHSSIPWDGLGWTCENCGCVIEPNPEEVRQAVLEL